ncbi:MAG: GDP-mannose 4,6-dehydratase [Planctomycetota bacterium]|nr:GDP-mannose 4,6-dehydratase [Planctomycetota bacterium]
MPDAHAASAGPASGTSIGAAPAPGPGSGAEGRRVLVTGGAGFVGSHLTERLLARGDAVTVIDDLSTGRRTNLPAAHPRLRFIHADLRAGLEALRAESFDEIYHLAAAVGVALVMAQPVRSIEINVGGTAEVFAFARGRAPGGAGCPVLVTSSSEVYGKSGKELFSEDDDVVYGPTTVTRWSYAASKALDEHLALAYARQHAGGDRASPPAVVVRLFNTVGPRQVGDYGMVLPRFVKAAMEGGELLVHGDGQQTRCFADVRDVSGVLPKLLGARECWGRVFNVGSDEPISILGLAELCLREVKPAGGRAGRVRMVPYDSAFPVGFEDLRRRRPDLARVRGAVGYRPEFALDQTVRDVARAMSPSS